MRCPYLKKSRRVERCTYKGDCPVLARAALDNDLNCFVLTDAECRTLGVRPDTKRCTVCEGTHTIGVPGQCGKG